MKVVFIGHSGKEYPHTRVRCYGFAQALEKHGIETEVLSFKEDLAPQLSEQDMYGALRDRDKMRLVCRAIGRLWKDRSALLYVQKVHFHTAAPWFLSHLGTRYVLDYDDYDIPLSNFFVRGRWNRLWFGTNQHDRITYRVAQRAAGCVVSSHALEEVLKPHNPNLVRIETGVDTEACYPLPADQKTDRPLTYFWNGVVWGDEIFQCVTYAMEAFRQVYKHNPHSRFLIIGGGWHWERLVEHARREFHDVPIVFRGWMPPSALRCVLREVDVGVLPFAATNEWVKCKSPTKLYEYLASGLAVVATNFGEAAHIIQHGQNGLLVDDHAGMAEAMIDLARDPLLRTNLATAARQTAVTRYSYDVLGEKLANFLRVL